MKPDRRNRSRIIEEAVTEYLDERRRRARRDRRDVEILNRHAERLNREAEDVLAHVQHLDRALRIAVAVE